MGIEDHQSPKLIFSLGAVLLLFIIALCRRCSTPTPLPDSLPWVGLRSEWLQKPRAHLRDAKYGHEYLKEGYEKYSKKGKAFISPHIGFREVVVLPPSSISWLLRQPEDRVSQPKMMSRMLQSRYLLPAHPADEVFHASTIRVDLNRHLAALTSDIADEIRAGLADAWGTDTSNFRSVCVLDTVKHISTRISTRVFFGQELTRDSDFLAHTGAFSTMLTACSGLLALFAPRALRPLLGPLVALPVRYHAWSMNRKLLPLIQRRLTTLSSSSSPPLPKKGQPNDLLQYHVASALASPSPSDRLPATIAARLQLLLGFAAIPTIHLTLGNALLNLSACPPPPPSPAALSLDAIGPADPSSPSPPSPEALCTLRDEASTVLGEHGGTWTRPSLLQLVRADSFLKETMRLDIFAGRGLLHEVVAEGGVTLPGEGAVVPKGAWVGVAASEMQKDEDVYGPGAGEFEGWRFVVGEAKKAEERDDMGGAGKGRSMSTTSDTFLAFSRGRHACPGRFFAANVMKLVLAHVAMEYDIKPLEKRPENVTISDVSVPPSKARIEVRRRERVLC